MDWEILKYLAIGASFLVVIIRAHSKCGKTKERKDREEYYSRLNPDDDSKRKGGNRK